MARWLRGTAILAAVFAAVATAQAAEPTPPLFTLSSPAFADDGLLPVRYAGGAQCNDARGGNLSPPLAWSNAPKGTKSFAVMMSDPDGQRGLGSVHWLAYGIPAARTGLAEGDGAATARDITAGKNSRGTTGYSGPCGPPIDAPHHYVIQVLALDLAPDALPPGLDRDELVKAIAGHSLGPASLVARYRRVE